jgi:hypothetical protein
MQLPQALILAIAVLVNGALFAVYRWRFLRRFAPGASASDRSRALRAGARLDAAWLGLLLALTGATWLAGICFGRTDGLPTRVLFWEWWLLTGIHAFVCVANFFTFAERGQGAGELLLPYITAPYQVYLAVMPFVLRRRALMLALAAGCLAFLFAGGQLAHRCAPPARDAVATVPPRAHALAAGAALSAVPLLALFQFVPRRKTGRSGKARSGWRLTTTKAKYYMTFPDYACNQAVMNPLLEFFLEQVPSHFRRTIHYRLSEAEALRTWRELTRRPAAGNADAARAPAAADSAPDAEEPFPLLERIRGWAGSPIENLIILQVEGFTQSVLEQERHGRAVMPFVRRLAAGGYYFPDTLQCANFTSGGVFSTMTSMPRATYDEPGSRFASYELHGYYGSPARVFGPDGYTHFFLFGFRQSCGDFTAFAANQGCTVLGYLEFAERFRRRNRLARADTLLGIFDGYFLEDCAELLLECPTRFTAHLVTTSTHSPWATPPEFERSFAEPALNTFAYLDEAIQRFCERLQRRPGLWERTLLVILGDHTSVTFSDQWLERLRIPLVFYNPALPPRPNPDRRRASQVDVLPTALALFPGQHRYAGMGRNLLDPAAPDRGCVSGSSSEGWFVKGDWVLRYDPREPEPRLFALREGRLDTTELTAQQPETWSQLRREYFATVELARRLALQKRIFPMPERAR